MKGRKTEVVDDPEMEQLKKNTQILSNAIYHGEAGRKEIMEKTRPGSGLENRTETAQRPLTEQ